MDKLTKRSELIKLTCELKVKWPHVGMGLCEEFARHIIADRKRICEPLVKFYQKNYGPQVVPTAEIIETFERAGISLEEI